MTCESGDWSGEPCDGGEAEFRIAFVPNYCRGTADTLASNNGLLSEIKVCACCYNHILTFCAEDTKEAKYVEFVD